MSSWHFFVVFFSSLPKMINNFSLCFAFTFYVKLQGHRVHSCVAPFINTCKFLAYLSPDTRAHTHYHSHLMPSSTLPSPFSLFLENENKLQLSLATITCASLCVALLLLLLLSITKRSFTFWFFIELRHGPGCVWKRSHHRIPQSLLNCNGVLFFFL